MVAGLCFGWTGGFLASLHRWGMDWGGRKGRLFFAVTLEWLRLARHGEGTAEGLFGQPLLFVIIHGWNIFSSEGRRGVKGLFF